VAQLTGGPTANFTADHKGVDRHPAWSPDGNQIAFASERDGRGIYLMLAIGGPSQKVSPAASARTFLYSPEWSSDGAELAYILVEDNTPFIEIILIRTRESRRLRIPGPAGNRHDLRWSPDGRFFAYVRAGGLGGVSWPSVLRVSDAQAFAVNDVMSGYGSPM